MRIKLNRNFNFVDGGNYRYINALMLEARFRGYDEWWHDGSLSYIPDEIFVGFKDSMNRIVDWLVTNFPSEFELI